MAQLRARFPVQEVEHALLPSRFACPTAILRDPSNGQACGMTDPMQPVAGAAAAARAA